MKTRPKFFDTELGIRIEKALHEMTRDKSFNTASTYSADSETYPDNLISFVDKHMTYLVAHPSLDAQMYVANLRLMTRKRHNF